VHDEVSLFFALQESVSLPYFNAKNFQKFEFLAAAPT
jgi:hypothetical protein